MAYWIFGAGVAALVVVEAAWRWHRAPRIPFLIDPDARVVRLVLDGRFGWLTTPGLGLVVWNWSFAQGLPRPWVALLAFGAGAALAHPLQQATYRFLVRERAVVITYMARTMERDLAAMNEVQATT